MVLRTSLRSLSRSSDASGITLTSLLLEHFQVAVGIQCGHAACAGRGDGLAVDVVLYVSGGKYPINAGGGEVAFGTAVGADITIIHVKLSLEDGGVGRMTDGDEDAVH